MKRRDLEKQLMSQRTKPSELDDLMTIADRLGHTELPTLSRAARQRIEEATVRPSKTPRVIAFSLAGSFAALAVVVIGAQSAQPGSPLYAVKNTTDTIHAFFFPKQKAPETPATTPTVKSLDQPTLKEVNGSSIVTEPAQPSKRPDSANAPQQPDGKRGSDKKSDRQDDRKSHGKSDQRRSDNWLSERLDDLWRR